MNKSKGVYWRAYYQHKANAESRGIGFLLTYEEWLKIWMDSGKINQRGSYRGKYVMARFGDIGPYAVGNVKIILHTENLAERDRSFDPPPTESARANMSRASLGKPKSADHRRNISIGKMGHQVSLETKAKISESVKRNRWMKKLCLQL
jgi:hypothetical protein